jgi:hypothetical protein
LNLQLPVQSMSIISKVVSTHRENKLHSLFLMVIFSFLCNVVEIIVCPFSFGHFVVCPSIYGLCSYPFGIGSNSSYILMR